MCGCVISDTRDGVSPTGSKTPGGAGHTRQTHDPHKPPQNYLSPQSSVGQSSPIDSPLTRQTHTRTPERTRARSPQTTAHRTHPIKGLGCDFLSFSVWLFLSDTEIVTCTRVVRHRTFAVSAFPFGVSRLVSGLFFAAACAPHRHLSSDILLSKSLMPHRSEPVIDVPKG